jgi:hypothetical protein
MLFLALVFGGLYLILEVMVGLLFRLSFGLVQYCFFEDDPHYLFVVQIFLAEFELIEHLLPLRWDFLSVKTTICQVDLY